MTTRNIIDNVSTAVSTSTPGPQLDLTYRTTVGRASLGVPVRFWAFASCTITAAGGVATIKNSAGTVLISVSITGTTAAWYYTDGYLPATDAKYDFHFGDNTLGILTPLGVMLEQRIAP